MWSGYSSHSVRVCVCPGALNRYLHVTIHSVFTETVAFATTCFGLMDQTSHNLSFVAGISTFFAVLAEFEVFVVCNRHVFHTSDFSPFSQSRLSLRCRFRLTHAYACAFVVIEFRMHMVISGYLIHHGRLHYFKNLLMLILPVQLEC